MKLKSLNLLEGLTLLIEASKEEMIIQNQGDQVMHRYKEDIGRRPTGWQLPAGHPWDNDVTKVVEELAKIHPKYLVWVVNYYIRGQFKIEDAHQLKLDLQEFDRIKPQLENKDINQIKTNDQLYELLDKFKEKETVSGKEQGRRDKQGFYDRGEAENFYKDGTITVVIPKTPQAAIFFGKNTKWCTTWSDSDDQTQPSSSNAFKQYNKVSPLYIILTNTGEKYQFYFGGKDDGDYYDGESVKQAEFQDALNKDLGPKGLDELIKKYPSVVKAFAKLAKKHSVWPLVTNPTEANFKAMIDEYKYDSEREDFNNVVYYNYDFDVMEYIMKHNPSDEVLDYAIQHGDHDSFKYLKEYPKYQTDKRIKLALKVDPFNIQYVTRYKEEYGLYAVDKSPRSIRVIPEDKQTYRLVKKALERAGEWDEQVGWQYQNTTLLGEINPSILKKHPDLIMRALKGYGDNLQFVPSSKITPEMSDIAFKSDPASIQWIPPEHQTKEMAEVIIFSRRRRGKNHMYNLAYLDSSLYTEDDLIKAVTDKEFGVEKLKALRDNSQQTMRIARAAIKAHGVNNVFDKLSDIISQKILNDFSPKK